MTRGHNYSIYHFKITNLKELKTNFYLTHKEVKEDLGFPRNTLYYAMRNKNGKFGDYIIESCRVPKREA
tara:strand:- start:1060 stop:1266 length:207 start_codon:yes stop_codon:yes gene_type:complete